MSRDDERTDGVRVAVGFPARAVGMPACRAPAVQLHFNPDGAVSVCCRTSVPLGRIGEDRLVDLWNGTARRALEAELDTGRFPTGCQSCAAEVSIEGRERSYPALFDVPADLRPSSPQWPERMEFNLSNACNLQCIQCHGGLSSAIRAHRERRPPLRRPYDEQFFDDLRPFLVHLRSAQFAGGEPFLAPENMRVWELMHEVGSAARCTVVTNATQWNAQVERALGLVTMGFAISLDGFTAQTFEQIRVGADHRTVMANTERFIAHARSAGTEVTINHCLMVQNHHELGDLLLWADERGLSVEVITVRRPSRCAIPALPPEQLLDVATSMERQDERVAPQLGLNADVWARTLEQVRRWAGAAEEQRRELRAAARYGSILGFAGLGTGPHDDTDAAARIARAADDPVAHAVTVTEDEIVTEVSESIRALLGAEPEELAGRHVDALSAAFEARFGPQLRRSQVSADADERHLVIEHEHAVLHVALVAVRDEGGRLLRARILFGAQQHR